MNSNNFISCNACLDECMHVAASQTSDLLTGDKLHKIQSKQQENNPSFCYITTVSKELENA
jgi:hypothetical protein